MSDDETNPTKVSILLYINKPIRVWVRNYKNFYFQELTDKEGHWIEKEKVNLQGLASALAYEYSSRDSTGPLILPDPQSYAEAREQLIQHSKLQQKKLLEKEKGNKRHVVTTYLPDNVSSRK